MLAVLFVFFVFVVCCCLFVVASLLLMLFDVAETQKNGSQLVLPSQKLEEGGEADTELGDDLVIRPNGTKDLLGII